MESPVSPWSVAAPPGFSSAVLSSESPKVAVGGLPASPAPIAVAASSDAESFVFFFFYHSVLLYLISSVLLLSVQSFLSDPLSLFCAGGSADVCGLPPAYVAVLAVPSDVFCSSPSMSCVSTRPSLFPPPALLPPPLLSHGLLCPPEPPLKPPPPALATNIARKEEDISNWTGRGETR